MTPKQQRFVEEYLVDLNATQAALRVGYSPKTARSQGQRLLTKADIAKAIAEGQAKLAERTEVTQEWIIEQLRENHRLALNPGPDQSPNIAASNKALELLGRHLAMFTDVSKSTVTHEFEKLPDSALDEQIRRQEAVLGLVAGEAQKARSNGSGQVH